MINLEYTPGYEVSENGDVYSIRRNNKILMKQHLNGNGYKAIPMVIDGKEKHITIHRLVAAKYLPNRPSEFHEIRHLDGNKLNNHYSNLAWGTKKENAEDRELHGRTARGAMHGIKIKAGIKILICPKCGRKIKSTGYHMHEKMHAKEETK